MIAKKWIKDTRISRKMNKNSIVGSRDGWIEVEYEVDNPYHGETFTAPVSGTYEITMGTAQWIQNVNAGEVISLERSRNYNILKVKGIAQHVNDCPISNFITHIRRLI